MKVKMAFMKADSDTYQLNENTPQLYTPPSLNPSNSTGLEASK